MKRILFVLFLFASLNVQAQDFTTRTAACMAASIAVMQACHIADSTAATLKLKQSDTVTLIVTMSQLNAALGNLSTVIQYNALLSRFTADSAAKAIALAGKASINPTITNNVTLTIQTVAAAANGSRISTTYAADVSYSATIISTASISGSAVGYSVLEICPTNSAIATDWIEVGRAPNGQAVSLAVVLQSVSTGGGQITGTVPAGYYRRLRSVNTTGTQTFTYASGQERLIN